MSGLLRSLFARRGATDITVGEAMLVDFARVTPETTVEDAMGILRTTFQRDFPVVDHGRLVGIVRRRDLTAELLRDHPSHTMHSLMHRHVHTARTTEPLDHLLARWPSDHHAIFVVEHDALIGMLDRPQLHTVGAL